MEGADLKDVAKAMAKFKKANTKRPRIAVVTNGAKPVIVAQNMPGEEECSVTEYEIAALTKEQIVDTNGAGDAHIGAFIACLTRGQSPPAAALYANIAAALSTKRYGPATAPERFEIEETLRSLQAR